MCVVSMVTDHYMKKWPQPAYVPSIEDYINFQELVRKAAEYDKITNQPNCPDAEKIDWQNNLADNFKRKYSTTLNFGPHTSWSINATL